jgi:hypothetical protein
MQTVAYRLLLLILVVGAFIFAIMLMAPKTRKQTMAEAYSGGYGWPYELPPLNFYTGTERDILSFWYDPVVDGDGRKDTTWGISRELPPGHETNIDEVFGPDSYQRYYAEDIDVSQP